MPAAWFESDVVNALTVVGAALFVLLVARRVIIAIGGPQEKPATPRRPGGVTLPPPRTCPAEDCGSPNRPDALYCRRCGTRLDGGKGGR